jgi:hypothetical protein
MNGFVDECRREWKRLRVPDPVADEMATELVADLDEAEAEGASAEDVLGSGASDPRAFAASWAAERGVVPPPPLTASLPRRSVAIAAIAALTVVAAVSAALTRGLGNPDDDPPRPNRPVVMLLPDPGAVPRTFTVRPAPDSGTSRTLVPLAGIIRVEPGPRIVLQTTPVEPNGS